MHDIHMPRALACSLLSATELERALHDTLRTPLMRVRRDDWQKKSKMRRCAHVVAAAT